MRIFHYFLQLQQYVLLTHSVCKHLGQYHPLLQYQPPLERVKYSVYKHIDNKNYIIYRNGRGEGRVGIELILDQPYNSATS